MTKLDRAQFVREIVVEPYEAEAYGVAPGAAKVPDYWTEAVLSDRRWILAARIVPDKVGNTVIGEIRIFPNEPNRPEQYAATGLWGGDVLGFGVKDVPRGGVPSTLLRRGIRLSEIERDARLMISMTLPLTGMPPDHSIAIMATRLANAGFKRYPIFPKTRGSLGRPPLNDLVYAKLARDYVAAFDRSGRAVSELAKTTGKTPAAIRSRIARARAGGFLSLAVDHGTGGGTLTEKSHQIIAASQRIATDSKTARSKAPQVRVTQTKNARQSPRRKKRA